MIHFFLILILITTSTNTTFSQELFGKSADTTSIFIENKKHLTFERLRELTILKAAKLTQSLGYTHFEFMYPDDKPISGSVERQGNIVRDVYGNASQSSAATAIFPTPIRDKEIVFVKFCNDYMTPCKGISARDAIKDLHP